MSNIKQSVLQETRKLLTLLRSPITNATEIRHAMTARQTSLTLIVQTEQFEKLVEDLEEYGIQVKEHNLYDPIGGVNIFSYRKLAIGRSYQVTTTGYCPLIGVSKEKGHHFTVIDPKDHTYRTTIQNFLMKRPGYLPYCSDPTCCFGAPRVRFKSGQLECACGWRSTFNMAFIQLYRLQQNKYERALRPIA